MSVAAAALRPRYRLPRRVPLGVLRSRRGGPALLAVPRRGVVLVGRMAEWRVIAGTLLGLLWIPLVWCGAWVCRLSWFWSALLSSPSPGSLSIAFKVTKGMPGR